MDKFRLICLQAINAVNEEDIKIIAYMLHSHTAGYGMRVRHVRDGVELPPIGVDNSYDFNFQEFRTPVQEIVVKAVCIIFVTVIINYYNFWLILT